MTAVGFRCDAGPEIGVGHLVRCVALAEELRGRGVEVVFLGAVNGSEWARAQLGARGLPLVAAPADPAGLAALARRLGLGAVVLDSYELARETGAALRGAGLAVLAIVDGDPLGQDADLYLDQNLGADHRPPPAASARLGEAAASARPVGAKGSAGRPGGAKGSAGWPGGARVSARWLAGARYVLLRDSVRALARAPWPGASVPRVLCFFGGTDSAGVAPAWAEALRATGVPFEATVISPAPFAAGGPIAVVPPTDRLPALMAGADLVVTAAGSAIWELLYLGVPTALTWVAGNQLIGYRELVDRGVAAGLGGTPDASAVARLTRLLTDPAARENHGRKGRGLVDGKGRERVADALLTLL